MELKISKQELDTLGAFVAETPPLLHKRKRVSCYSDCDACKYLEKQKAAVDVVCKLRIQEDEYDIRGFVE